jgi:hypothetical protein
VSLPNFKPVAIYLPDSDSLEYVNRDCASLYEPVDADLAIIRAIDTRQVIGFRLNNWSKLFIGGK